ncbi:MAG: DUF3427 domain-containing protein [Clostridiaceae bacterium]
MDLKRGIYEQVINKSLNEEIKKNIDTIDIYKDDMDTTNSSELLSNYLKYILKKGLNYYSSKSEDVLKQIGIANRIINEFAELIEDDEFNDYAIDEMQILKGIFNKDNIKKDMKKIQPITSISKSSLFTGAHSEPTVFSELNKEIRSADRVDLLVSFIKFSGLRLLMDSLKEHTKTKKLRIITTSYMAASDYNAIKMLAELPNTEVKISYDNERTRLHAKAYYFHRETGFSTAYIGSSNMSKAALTEGTEWNMKISEYTSREVIEKYKATFETYWNLNEFKNFDINNIEHIKKLKKSLSQAENKEKFRVFFDIMPYAYQQEILDKLEVERTVFNSYKNLIVAATGTGKTVVSAFDFKRYYKGNTNCRLLFLAHRKEILEQSIDTFRIILKDQNFGDLWVGEHSPIEINSLFTSIQTLNAGEKYKNFSEDHFDFIILDETHHGAADSYSRLLNYFKPKILLGLTATPERMDGEDIMGYFNNRVAYEIRLQEAIDRNLLCPFHYFGVTDNVSLENVKWARGSYENSELANLYTGNNVRADLILQSMYKYINEIDQVKGLGFCVSREHARFMKDYFISNDIPAINLDSNSSIEERNSAKSKLVKGEIKFIFVVDLYNEGVDIPDVNTVLFLRPTESATVFIQQLGRGLRISEGKDVLTVLDFVGQANKQFDFRTKFRSIIGKTNDAVEKEIDNGFPTLPKGCFVQLERKAQEYILQNLKNTYANKNNLRKMIRNYSFETNKPLNLSNFLNHYGLESFNIYKSCSFYELCYLEKVKDSYEVNDKKDLNTALRKVMNINSIKFIDFILKYLKKAEYSLQGLKEEENLMLLMFHYTVWNYSPEGELVYYLYKLRYDNKSVFCEIIEILEYNKSKVDFIEEDIDLGYVFPLKLYSNYSTDQILAAFGEHTVYKKKSFREGVLYIKKKDTDIFFITLNKSEKHFSITTQYNDYAINERFFHWQSQSRTSDISPTGQRYINQRKNKNKILLFVREFRSENGITSPFYFLGKGSYVSHNGSKPISITFEMERPIPTFLLKKSNKVVDVI